MGTGLPQFLVRWRVTTVAGVAVSSSAVFESWLSAYYGYSDESRYDPSTNPGGNRFGAKQTLVGGAMSGWFAPSTSEVQQLSTLYYGRSNSPYYQQSFDFGIAHLVLKPVQQFTVLAGEIQVAETSEIVPFTCELWPFGGSTSGAVGVIFYRQDPQTGGLMAPRDAAGNITGGVATYTTGQEGVARANTLNGYARSHYHDPVFAALPTPPVQRSLFHISDRCHVGDTDRLNELQGWETIGRLGGDVAMLNYAESRQRVIIEQAGLTRYNFEIYYPPDAHFDFWRITNGFPGGTGDAPGVYQTQAEWLAGFLTGAGFDLSRLDYLSEADEPFWYFGAPFDSAGNFARYDMLSMVRDGPAQPAPQQVASPMTAALQAYALGNFRSYLQAQGLAPADVGHSGWTSVLPVGQSYSTGTLAQRTLFYWTCRWYAHDAAKHYTAWSTELRAKLRADLPLTLNYHNGGIRLYDTVAAPRSEPYLPDEGSGDFDWFEMARMGGPSAPSFADYTPDSLAWVTSVRQNLLDQAARRNPLAVPAYACWMNTVGGTSDIPGVYMQRVNSVIGNGARKGRRYWWGPMHAGADGNGAEQSLRRPSLVANLRAEADFLGQYEADIFYSVPVRPPVVGIVFGKSAQMWDGQDKTAYAWDAANPYGGFNVTMDHISEMHCIATVLMASQVPFRVLEEEELDAATLATYKVVYLTSPNVPAEAQTALAAWVNAGGRLYTSPGAAHFDRYNSASTTIRGLGGIVEASRSRQAYTPRVSILPANVVGGPGGTVPNPPGGTSLVTGSANPNEWRPSLAGSAGTVIATWSDNGSPAVVKAAAGSGFHYKAGALLASGAIDDAWASPQPGVKAAFEAAAAALVTLPVTDLASSVFRKQVEGLPFVCEAPMSANAGPNGKCVVFITNWPGTAFTVPTLRIRPVFADGSPMTVGSVVSRRLGSLPFTTTSDGITIANYSGQYDDTLFLSPGAGPPADTTPPAVLSAAVNGATGSITYDEVLNAASVPAISALVITVNSVPVTVTGIGIGGSAVTFTLASAVPYGATVTRSYTPGASPIEDVAGNNAAGYSNQPVTNNTPQPPPPPSPPGGATGFSSALGAVTTRGGTMLLGYVPPPAVVYPSVSTLSDAFNVGAIDMSRWVIQQGASQSGGVLHAPAATGLLAGVRSVGRYDLTGASVFAEVVAAPASGDTRMRLAYWQGATSGDWVEITQSGALLLFRQVVASVASETSVTYSPTAHRWWRIREIGGNIEWLTSPDGQTWTTRRAVAAGIPVVDLKVELHLSPSATGPGEATFDNLNVSTLGAGTVGLLSTSGSAHPTIPVRRASVSGGLTTGGTATAVLLSTALAAPTGVLATVVAGGIDVTWTAASGATGYEVLRGSSPGGPYGLVGTTAGTIYQDRSTVAGRSYFYVVRATGPDAPRSAPSNEVSATSTAPFLYAKRWVGSFTDNAGNTLVGPVYARLRGTATLATTYTDETKAATAANPVMPDSAGNVAFWLDPGYYDIVMFGVIKQVDLGVGPKEPSAAIASQGRAPAVRVFSGAGVPVGGQTGDVWVRTDTPGVTGQRVYERTATGAWVAML